MLKQRGIDHEAAYAEHLSGQGLTAAEVGPDGTVDRVVELMRARTDVILQAPLADGRYAGVADFLRKVPRPSALGDFSYEVIDTKLALGWMTPADVHSQRTEQVQAARSAALDAAYHAHPERFVRRPPVPPSGPVAVWINPPKAGTAGQ